MAGLGALMIEFHLNNRSGVAPYLQLIRQVRQALRLGLLRAGDQLPTVKDVAGSLAINPNTVLKAYRLLEYEGLAAAKPGVGTFVTKTISDESVAAHQRLSMELSVWIGRAQQAGLDFEDMEALFQRAARTAAQEEAV
jgi:GntR family transcriptional regulator